MQSQIGNDEKKALLKIQWWWRPLPRNHLRLKWQLKLQILRQQHLKSNRHLVLQLKLQIRSRLQLVLQPKLQWEPLCVQQLNLQPARMLRPNLCQSLLHQNQWCQSLLQKPKLLPKSEKFPKLQFKKMFQLKNSKIVKSERDHNSPKIVFM